MKADIFLAMKYERLVMRLDEVCHEIGAEIGTVRNKMSAGTFPIPTRKEGKYVVADVRDVGSYLDRCREEAVQAHVAPDGPKAKRVHENHNTENSQNAPSKIFDDNASLLANGIAEAVGKRVALAIPGSLDLWDTSDVATYLKRSANTVRREIDVQPSFPKPVRLPGTAKPQALYIAREVVQWAESFQQPSKARKAVVKPL
ncbi:hypothetical protein [Massilia violaceinigra]|uniref:hypothetical protein n=1 Tax=Massilia violaceinigra TaxID=2045208 RepID=UPI001ABF936B|nr:hypothetical protein [Massilia violaceinigra]